MRPVALILALTLITTTARAQNPPPPLTLSVNVRAVAVDAVVHDRNGDLVHNLTKDDFILTEDSKPQDIHYFSEDEDLPLTVGLLVDTSESQRPYFAQQQVATRIFFTNMLTHPQDNAFVVRFDTSVMQLQRMTSNLTLLESALSHLSTVYPDRPGPGGGTLLFDAICAAANHSFGPPSDRPGRRALVVLTDGDDQGSTLSSDGAIQCAEFGNVTVYTALYTPNDRGPALEDDPHHILTPTGPRLTGRTYMERISRASGGRVFIVNKKLPIEHVYALIQDDLRSQYRIAYTPPPSPSNRYHQFELKPRDKTLKIQSRIGYYTAK